MTKLGPRPVLPDDFGVGSTVTVIVPGKPSRRYATVVTKAARVWIDLEPVDGKSWPKWRMRRDTQKEGGEGRGYGRAWFVTPDQEEWDETVYAARSLLLGEGIDIRIGSAWREPGHVVELARMITAWKLEKES